MLFGVLGGVGRQMLLVYRSSWAGWCWSSPMKVRTIWRVLSISMSKQIVHFIILFFGAMSLPPPEAAAGR